MNTNRGLAAFAVVLLMSLAMCSGCIGGGDDTEETVMRFIFAASSDAVRLDPADVTDGESIQRTDNVYEGLVMYEEGSTEIKPCLATDWTVSDDKTEITFTLRQGVKFHNGVEMTADDVVFSFARQYDTTHPFNQYGEWAYWGYMFTDIMSVEKIDDYTVVMKMYTPNASLLTSLAMFTASIVSEDAAMEYGEDFFKNPVGTGPFTFVEWVKDDHITLEAFDDYWGGRPVLDEIVFKVIPDTTTRLLALQNGEIHGAEYLDPSQLSLVEADASLFLVSEPGMNVGYIALNCGEGYVDANGNGKWDEGEDAEVPGAFEPFQDIRVRQAIQHAINKQSIVDNLYQGAATVAVQGMPPGLLGYNYDLEGYAYNPALSRQLLEDAGYPNGFTVTMFQMGSTSRPYFPVPQDIAQAIQSDLAAVGITVNLFTEDWGTYLQDAEAGKAPMIMLGWSGDNGDPDNFLNVLYSQKTATVGTAGNYGFKKNQALQDILDQALLTFDEDERDELYQEANRLIVEEATHIFVAHSNQILAFNKSVKGFVAHPTTRMFFYNITVEE
ncbi:MAG: ABC transporter substrate-binding protein, partial [Candidatus Methanofastidiosa archaeon]|nr:ABC transporter substrate-binding protein [Candidatus Methanofastidiosa archaeon]